MAYCMAYCMADVYRRQPPFKLIQNYFNSSRLQTSNITKKIFSRDERTDNDNGDDDDDKDAETIVMLHENVTMTITFCDNSVVGRTRICWYIITEAAQRDLGRVINCPNIKLFVLIL